MRTLHSSQNCFVGLTSCSREGRRQIVRDVATNDCTAAVNHFWCRAARSRRGWVARRATSPWWASARPPRPRRWRSGAPRPSRFQGFRVQGCDASRLALWLLGDTRAPGFLQGVAGGGLLRCSACCTGSLPHTPPSLAEMCCQGVLLPCPGVTVIFLCTTVSQAAGAGIAATAKTLKAQTAAVAIVGLPDLSDADKVGDSITCCIRRIF